MSNMNVELGLDEEKRDEKEVKDEKKTDEKGLDEKDADRVITVVSKEGVRFPLSLKNASLSGLLRVTFEQDKYETELKINVAACYLAKIIDYLNHHEGIVPDEIRKPLRSMEMKELVTPWDAAFVDGLSYQELFDLMSISNYLETIPLTLLLGAKVATIIKGKEPEELKVMFKDVKRWTLTD